MNGDGIFAYKSTIIDKTTNGQHPKGIDIQPSESIDGKQYVLFNDDGLSLVMKKGAKVLNKAKTNYITVLDDQTVNTNSKLLGLQEIKRVEVSWDGFILRNLQNQRVFWADPQDGNLNIKGRIDAIGGSIGAWNFDGHKLWADSAVNDEGIYTTFVAINAGGLSTVDEYGHWDPIKKGNGEFYKDTNGNNLYVKIKDYAFWAGAAKPGDAPFYIKKDGVLKAASGQVGGWSMEGGLFYNPASLVLAPTVAKNSEGHIIVKIPIVDDNGNITDQYEEKEIPFNNLVLWVPSDSWREKYKNNTATIWESSADSTLTITQEGALTAKEINGCKQLWFTGGTIHSVRGSTSVTIRWYNPDGSISSHSFNTASGVKAQVSTSVSVGWQRITFKASAEAHYPSGGVISGSGDSETVTISSFSHSVQNMSPTQDVVRFYINGTQVYTVTVNK